MVEATHQKVKTGHLRRTAYLYIRQSTLKQVIENTESTKRQYALRRRAVALGWREEDIVVVDSDLGESADGVTVREGFQKLVSEVGMGRAGIVLGIEVSRLARNNADWHRLLEICALTDTLILDEDGLYDPGLFNDRLLLGLKGTMSEAELHVLKARLWGGKLSKAERGELRLALPIGFVYDAVGRVVLDPDTQVRESIRLFFETFRRTGAAMATVKYFREQSIEFPARARSGPNKGELIWKGLGQDRAIETLHNPRYAGAYVFGKTRSHKWADGGVYSEKLPQDQWHTLIRDAHPGYITWDEYEENLRRLRDNAKSYGLDHRRTPPREGPALLQGLAVCGICGYRMTVTYKYNREQVIPYYTCPNTGIERTISFCQIIQGTALDERISELLVEAFTPMALDVSLTVQKELQSRMDEADRLRRRQVERAQYEVDLARRRYMRVDPDNRLVADQLEADWNNKLRDLDQAKGEYERQRNADRMNIDKEQRKRILELTADFPRLWRDPKTPHRERKRMIRLLIEDVTIIKNSELTAHIRFKGGATKTITLPLPLNGWQLRKTTSEVVAEIDRLTDHHTDAQIVNILNGKGFRTGMGKNFTDQIVKNIRRSHGIKTRYNRLRETGLLTSGELAEKLGTTPETINAWRRNGMLKAHVCNDKNECLYEDPGDDYPVKCQGDRLSTRKHFAKFSSNHANEVQYGG